MMMILSVFVLAFALSSAALVSADDGEDDEAQYEACLSDGRFNHCDLAAPVAMFGNYTDAIYTNGEGVDYTWPELDSIELWGIGSDGQGTLDAYVTIDELKQAVAGQDYGVIERSGYRLVYSADGYLWVTAPDGYTFGSQVN